MTASTCKLSNPYRRAFTVTLESLQMQTTTLPAATQYPPLAQENRTHVTTEHAAYLLNRRPQTLRCWAIYENKGPLRPVRVNGRLAWPVSEIRRALLGVPA